MRLRVEPSGLVPVVAMPGVSFQSRLAGEHQPNSPPISGSALRSPPRLVWPPVIVLGVGQGCSDAAPSKSIPPV